MAKTHSNGDWILSSCLCEVEEIKKMKIGDPLDRSTDHGPQNHKAHLDKLLEYCEVGAKEGATLVYGGRQVDRPGTPRTSSRPKSCWTSAHLAFTGRFLHGAHRLHQR